MVYLLSLPTAALFAQHEESSHHEGSSHHDAIGVWEIFASGIYASPFSNEEEAGGVAGIEIHLTYWAVHLYGGGISYTAKFEEEMVHDIAILGSLNPTNWMTINAGPNFSLPSSHRAFSLGAYAESEFYIRPNKWFHFGPVFGTIIGQHSEYSIGFHLGFELYPKAYR